jgi:hypothetical protein
MDPNDGPWRAVARGRVTGSLATALGLLLASSPVGLAQTAAQSRDLIDRYCVGCHNDSSLTGGLTLEGISLAEVSENAETWERVVRKLRAGLMPPSGAPRPEAPVYDGLIAWLEDELDLTPFARPPARPVRAPSRSERYDGAASRRARSYSFTTSAPRR